MSLTHRVCKYTLYVLKWVLCIVPNEVAECGVCMPVWSYRIESVKRLEDYSLKSWKFDLEKAPPLRGKYISNWFSNMQEVNVEGLDDRILYPSVENYFQAHKVLDPDEKRRVALMTPYEAKRWARTIKPHSQWNDGLDVMFQALNQKWSMPKFKDVLLAHTEEIVEWNNWGDSKWGVPIYPPFKSGQFKGRNILGCMLMEIRASLS